MRFEPLASVASIRLHDIATAIQGLRFSEAERMARTYLIAAPNDEGGLGLLALALQRQGCSAAAAETHRRLTELFPQAPQHWNNLGTLSREAGDPVAAKTAYARALHLDSAYYNVWMNLGFLHAELGEFLDARDAHLGALVLEAGSIEARIHAARACAILGEHERARELIADWSTWPAVPSELAHDLAGVLLQLGRIDEARACLDVLLREDPTNIGAQAKMALICERLNRLDEARDWITRLPLLDALRDPLDCEDVANAHIALALREGDAEHVGKLLDWLRAHMPPNRHIDESWYFLLAQAHAKQPDPPRTMAALAQAHALQLDIARQVVPELLAPEAEPLKSAAIWIDTENYSGWQSDPTAPPFQASPVFVVGFPRSGTTMLEQMLDTAPGLKSMDERAFTQNLIERMSEYGLLYPRDLGRLTAAQCSEMRALYWQLTAEVAPRAPHERLVDKNPMNMLRLPLLKRLFPESPVILALRHPCDVILSNYMQHFRSSAFAVMCSSLERLANSYVAAMRFWIHHEALLAPRVLHSRYEDLLHDFAGSARRIGAFVGVEDPQPMLHFDRHARGKGFISTPSYAQVIEPPHKRSIGRWHAYAKYFEPVLPILDPIMTHWGYTA
jgi:Flp pilus assembly protein TadD